MHDSAPVKVELMRPQPVDPTPWEAFFQAPVVFGAPRYCLYYDESGFDMPLPGANRRLVELNQKFLDSYMQALNKHLPFSAQVSTCIASNLIAGKPSLQNVAAELGISRSTLQRRLGKEGMTFNALLDSVRRDLADKYLNQTQMSLSEVTYMLGFSDQSNFTHSFRRWHGCTPAKYREEHLETQALEI